jgi:hypothetical protein
MLIKYRKISLRINRNITAMSEGAIMIGRSISEKRTFLPGKIRSKRSARENPRMTSRIVANEAKIKVNRSESQKFDEDSNSIKLWIPAGLTVNSLNLSLDKEVLIPMYTGQTRRPARNKRSGKLRTHPASFFSRLFMLV